jgi:hypothetical protein
MASSTGSVAARRAGTTEATMPATAASHSSCAPERTSSVTTTGFHSVKDPPLRALDGQRFGVDTATLPADPLKVVQTGPTGGP